MPDANSIQLNSESLVGLPGTDPAKIPDGTSDGPNGSVQFTPPGTTPPEPPKTEERPAWLPEKFKTAEDLVKAYEEAEKKISAKPAPAKPETKVEEISLESFAEHFGEDGKLTDEAYAQLATKGISKSVADRYIAGQQALAAQQRSALAESVGGEEALKAVLEWAPKGLTKANIAGYNSLIDSGNIEAAKEMLAGFYAKYISEVGTDPSLVNAQGAGGTTGEPGFASMAEMVKAMQDKRYESDPAYRKMVERRAAKSTSF